MNYQYTLLTLSELLATTGTAEQGYLACAEHAHAPTLKCLFTARAHRHSQASSALRALILQMGGNPAVRSPLPAASRRGWRELATALLQNSDEALIDECSLGEDRALEVYRNALDDHLPDFVQQVLLRQFEEMMSDHDQIRFVAGDSLQGGLIAVNSGGEARQ